MITIIIPIMIDALIHPVTATCPRITATRHWLSCDNPKHVALTGSIFAACVSAICVSKALSLPAFGPWLSQIEDGQAQMRDTAPRA